ncbi:ABC transporter ATP-binding protein [Phocaeicola sp.]
MIEITDLHKNFGRVHVLNGIHLNYESGNIYGLVGENGAGKTTLFNCIMGMYDYTGNIIKDKALNIGYLSASAFFYSQITGLEHLEFCMRAKGLGIDADAIKHSNEIFQLPLDRYAAEYSTGMKKKLAFMALLLQDNDVYILDEPFNGVDLKGCILMKKLIRELKEEGKTVIVSSHLISSLREICDMIHYLYDGIIYKEYRQETTAEIEQDILQKMKN